MAKQLKIWNGMGSGKYKRRTIYVAAYSARQACEIIATACGLAYPISATELKDYYNKGCWGNSMKGIVPAEPCVYVQSELGNETPKRVL